MSNPTADDFRRELRLQLSIAERDGVDFVDINSGSLHRKLGGYPGRGHAMKNCCRILYDAMRGKDKIVHAPPKQNGATLTIRFALPR